MKKLTEEWTLSELRREMPEAISMLHEFGFQCPGCPSAAEETLRDACFVHGLNPDGVIERIHERMREKGQGREK
ncbi:MAG: DUF1858 domain-containing protein [Ndongobacter sp.]|nr:DUF1858 domain-containing protein [Ndongobacter sp.]